VQELQDILHNQIQKSKERSHRCYENRLDFRSLENKKERTYDISFTINAKKRKKNTGFIKIEIAFVEKQH
jgi:hypothetical protein